MKRNVKVKLDLNKKRYSIFTNEIQLVQNTEAVQFGKVESVFITKNIFLLPLHFRYCLVTEIRSQNEKCFLTCAYRSLSQTQEEFEIFCTNFS